MTINTQRKAGLKQLADIDWDNWQAKDPATLVFVIRDGKILLIDKKTGLGKGKVNGPGGKVEQGESPLQCAVRECQEELGITVSDLQYCGQHRFQFVDGYSIHVWVYRTDVFDGVPTETVEARPLWVPVDEIPYDQMWEDDRIWIPMMLRGEKFQGRWIFDGDAMLDYELLSESRDNE
ncbi:MAG: 8-oxo-dGTP diphosphatase [Gammaproteobacteria bacterium]|nr:8-oxo-dGTP diphosphatase [Gammaproteobacteria bacterium]MBT8074854.1 8-oxo-dGTP diphosphatase [Gammaproteobacteria bacterium]NNK98604.1 8-oxo-dGTP diphosphatase [Xanthomonadales bacterium]